MTSDAGILIVEDERIIAEDLRRTLESLGYSVAGIASSGEEAIKKAAETRPDLVLMDIRLQGRMDGTEAASRVRDEFDIPVVYLTAYADEGTLQRARITEPYGYIIKPFQQRELCSSIEIALYKHEMERRLKESERWLSATLKCIGEAVIATDPSGSVRFMNPIAEALTGWKQEDASDRRLQEVFKVIDEETQGPDKDPVGRFIQQAPSAKRGSGTLLSRVDGMRTPVEGNAGYIRDDKGNMAGVVLVFRDVTERRRAEKVSAQADRLRALAQMAKGIAYEVNNILVRVSGYADLALVNLGEHPGLARERIKSIILAANDVARVMRRLEALYRRADDSSDLVLLQLDPLVSQALTLVHPRWEHRGFTDEDTLRLRTNLTGPPPVRGQLDELLGALAEFIANAIRAIPRGGTLAVATGHDSTWSFVTVSDTDRGITSETKGDAFGPFCITRSDMGDDPGMVTAMNIVERHGGEILVETKPGMGTSFTLRLPTAEGFGGDGGD